MLTVANILTILVLPGLDGPRSFADGVRIDWQRQTVVVDAVVVLREGPLELLACTRGTREHESILVVEASPTHIYQAMGMIGLEPGSPVSFDSKTGKPTAARGQPLDIKVRYESDGKPKTHPILNWTLTTEGDNPPVKAGWVFAGSRMFQAEDGKKRLGAESEGTIVSVVDFDTALISIASLHTADNDALWLIADPRRVPGQGTRCELLISAVPCPIDVSVHSKDRLTVGGRSVSPKQLNRLFQENLKRPCRATVRIVGAFDERLLAGVVKTLESSGIPRQAIETQDGASLDTAE